MHLVGGLDEFQVERTHPEPNLILRVKIPFWPPTVRVSFRIELIWDFIDIIF